MATFEKRVFLYDHSFATYRVEVLNDSDSFMETVERGHGSANCSWRLEEILRGMNGRNYSNWREIEKPKPIDPRDATIAELEKRVKELEARESMNLAICHELQQSALRIAKVTGVKEVVSAIEKIIANPTVAYRIVESAELPREVQG